ncbi:hypothetical protein BASA50_009029 [Batrachochytrium salamandrivorans]|uniref:Iron-binding zinc finger CDGSH type domain-containing protein n=1 Tax=Batrachochytrium salamandrivorans TaxID=1357716 RepID=A0ABQ8F5I6_9FUNG|nr:hypothetical protein BASA62_000093 [Batrachochytrium salamandrivorans]KAH6575848.1 hypothetical protein BASA60_004787 [Batrachochytrium salamandrivorans]KAH6578462.1 hypothetical protein BASA61_000220 [Batrachochytrium salamandrivorans]KAH6591028.1 hypothetical protein BASA50_009029 [Batrachochytrium salamandrivorans]KAH9268245.1 hypothetical protein BASA84_000309 [Batrachochytrium salamandrivorans]
MDNDPPVVDVEACPTPSTCALTCLKPCVPTYSAVNVKGLETGSVHRWCTCGLSKKQPWCDDSHIGTPFKPLEWVVPGTKKDGRPQHVYSICACKYTQDPPYCDASHIHLPMIYLKAQRECVQNHSTVVKICSACGFRPLELDNESEPSS